MKVKIGELVLDNPVVLAPLAGITNLPFRLIAKARGCGLVCSEMISSNGLVRNSEKTWKMLESLPEEKPLSVQLFGADPFIMADAARMVEAGGADILDINLGCSVRKIVKTGAGVSLMREPRKAGTIFRAVREAIGIPFTVKIRSGWDASGRQAVEIARIAEDSGVDALAVHPRTATQGFRGKSDWSIITEVKRRIAIPVIGNGDIVESDDAVAMRDETGCDAVMVGRAAIGNPWIFEKILARLRGEAEPELGLERRFEVMAEYLESSIQHLGETRACRMMRSRLGWFVKGLPYSSGFRESIKLLSSRAEGIELIDAYADKLKADKIEREALR
ncbi:MAG: tRNA dihydrouridine synthase DusB [Desulfobacterales bacterium]|nr:tRNA dihydrouridine synthase DusB [Desulfobacterales bacterium]